VASQITGMQIFTNVGNILQDTTNVRWTQTELLNWLNAGQRTIALVKPNVTMTTQIVPLSAGTRQVLPSDIITLDQVVRNIASDGVTPGPAILPIEKVLLDNSYPGWHTAAASLTVLFYCWDDKDPTRFWVYPPQPTGTAQQVEAVMATLPASLTAASAVISLDDIYEGPLTEYILYRCFLKDSEFGAANLPQAMGHWQTMLELLQVKAAAEKMEGPVQPIEAGEQVAPVPPQGK